MKKDIFSILRNRFPQTQYALMEEVSDAAGYNRSRSADYIAVGLWPSRGLAVNGIELKSFRGDWLSELKKPEKAENIFKYCDYFWLLTADDTVAKLEEIPTNWGWLCIKGERITMKKDAPKLTPITISKDFMAAMLKRAQDKTNFVHIDSIQDRINSAAESARNETKNTIIRLEKELNDLRQSVLEFNKASGIDLAYYPRYFTNPQKIGEAVKLLQNGGAEPIKNDLLRLEEISKDISKRISEGLKVLQ